MLLCYTTEYLTLKLMTEFCLEVQWYYILRELSLLHVPKHGLYHAVTLPQQYTPHSHITLVTTVRGQIQDLLMGGAERGRTKFNHAHQKLY